MKENNFRKSLKRIIVLLVFAMSCKFTFAQNPTFGDGSQGSLSVSSPQVINNYYEIIAANQYSSSVRVNATGFSGGDYLLIQMTGVNAGIWEFINVNSTSGQFLLLAPSTQVTQQFTINATNKAQAIKVPNYTNVTVNSGGILTCLPYNAATGIGGILVFKANGTFTINIGGKCDVSSTGFPANASGGSVAGGAGGAGGNATNIHAALASIPNTGLNGGGNGGLQMNNAGGGNAAVSPVYPGVATIASNATLPITNPTHPNLYLGACGLSGNSGNSGKGAGGGGAGVGANPCNNGQDGEAGGNGGSGGMGGVGGGLILVFANTTDIHGNAALVASGGNGSTAQNGGNGGKGGNGANGCGSCTIGGAGGGGNGANGGNGGNGGSGGASGFIYIKKSSGTTLNNTICQLLGGNGANGGNGGSGGVAGLNANLVGAVANCPNNSGGGVSGTPTVIPINSTCNLTAVMNALITIGSGAYTTQNISSTVTEYSLGGNTVTIDATNNNRAIVIAVVNGFTYHAVIDITNAGVSILSVLQNVLNGNTTNATWNGNDLNFTNGSAVAGCDVLPTRNSPVDGNAGSGGSNGGSGGNGDFYEDIVATCSDVSSSIVNVYNVCCSFGGGFDCSSVANDFFNMQSDPVIGFATDTYIGNGTTIYTISSSQGCTYTFECTNSGANQNVDIIVNSITNPSSALANDGSVYINSVATFSFGLACGGGAFYLNDANGNTIADNNSFPSGTVTGLAPGTYTAYPDGCGILSAPIVFTLTAPSCQNTASTTTASICASTLPYHWNGNNYATAGSYIVHLNNAGGCDSAATLNLTLKSNTGSTTNTSICAGALPYVWNSRSFTSAGSYTVYLINSSGCDSAATLNLTVGLPAVTQTENLNGCSYVLYNSNNYYQTTTLHENLQNIYGCDSVYKTISIVIGVPTATIAGASSAAIGSTLSITNAANAREIKWYNNGTLVSTQTHATNITPTTAAGGNGYGNANNQAAYPYSVALDILGNVYTVNTHFHSVEKWDIATNTKTIVAGSGNQNVYGRGLDQLFSPRGVFVDNSFNVYVADGENHRVVKWTPGATTGTIVAGGDYTSPTGPTTTGLPSSVFVDAGGNIYVACEDEGRIQKWAPGATSGVTVAGIYGYFPNRALPDVLYRPAGVYVTSNGDIYVADMFNNRVQKFAAGSTTAVTVAGQADGTAGDDACHLHYPHAVSVDNSGNVFVADSYNSRVQMWAPGATSGITVAGGIGNGTGAVNGIEGLGLNAAGEIFAASVVDSRVTKWVNPTPTISTTFTPTTTGDYNAVITYNNCCQATTNTVSMNAFRPGTPITGNPKSCVLNTTTQLYHSNKTGVWQSSNTGVASINQGGVVTALANGLSTISYTYSIGGNMYLSTIDFIVASISTPVTITGSTNVCLGSTIQLSATPTGGVWVSLNNRSSINTNTGVVTGLAGGGAASIKYTISNASGCTAFSNYNVTVNSLPNIPSIGYAAGTPNPQRGAAGAFCTNKTFTVVGSPVGGVWSKTGVISVTTPAGVVSTGGVAGSGSLTYTYTNTNGCTNNRTIASNIVACAFRGMNGATNEKQETRNEFTMFPNPAKTFIRLNVETLMGAGTIVVTDLYGKQVATQSLSMGTNRIDVSTFAKGIYFVSMITNEGKTTKKLVIE